MTGHARRWKPRYGAPQRGHRYIHNELSAAATCFQSADECFKYVLSLPFADSIAVGMQSVEEIDANVNYFENLRFDEADIARLNNKKRRILVEDWCTGCGNCRAACGQNAMRLDGGRAVCDPAACILCGYCSGHCPMWAIKII